jgi:hypothetical protein
VRTEGPSRLQGGSKLLRVTPLVSVMLGGGGMPRASAEGLSCRSLSSSARLLRKGEHPAEQGCSPVFEDRGDSLSGTAGIGLGPIPAYRTQACSVITNDENPTSFAPVRNEADLLRGLKGKSA